MKLLFCILFAAFSFQAQAFSVTRRQALATAAATAVGTVLWQPQNAQAVNGLYTPAPQSLIGQTIVITGGTTGLGLESAKRLAIGGANIILTARTTTKGEKAVSEVQQYLRDNGIDNPMVSYKVLNLDDLSAVKKVPESWNDVKKIDVLMNNAGVMAIPDRQLTVDGYERQIQTNHLGHFVLTALLQPKLASDARIVNVSSQAYQFASKMRSDESLWEPQPNDYSPWVQYGQTKLANILFTEELQRRSEVAGKQWTVVSLHPGAVATGRFHVHFDRCYNHFIFSMGS
ncbi:hypothetical protein FisN_11Lh017 [Fistulifera solaris]|uniref:Uncharacterized protein n=1 Tax=Fistulifera solaris TaxID=1519565 RepID=A0A1Z5J7N9_FISSO|nr:hypothetical protein FisN_11Lh017 [Fistulifera solaris]|eukprot:GAX09990.1 hypothetical protein FisN_11Lh017 [Fistulifera solaris]